MGFVAVMLFTRSLYKVFELECLILLIIKVIIILNQISAWSCLSIFFFFYKNACNVLSQSSKEKESTLPHEIIFVFMQYFIRAILSKNSYQKGREVVGKKVKRGIVTWWRVEVCLQKEDETFYTLCTKMFQNKTL